jgi:hypothetical protein
MFFKTMKNNLHVIRVFFVAQAGAGIDPKSSLQEQLLYPLAYHPTKKGTEPRLNMYNT